MSDPCWPECRAMLLAHVELTVKRIEAIMAEREKATKLLARDVLNKQQAEMMEKYVLREAHTSQISHLQEQITGRLGLELRMRRLEQASGAVDAKLYMIIIGIPLIISILVTMVLR